MAERGCFVRAVAMVAAVAAWMGVPGRSQAAEPKELLAAFLKEPTKESYLRLFEAVTSAPSYNPYSRDLDEATDLMSAKKHREAQEKLEKAMPNLLLSPRAHQFASIAAKGLGDDKKAESERDTAAACLKGILLTGDGSGERPYLVTRVSDEYDLLRHLKKGKKAQSLRQKDGKSYDVMSCADGSEVWFDITAMFGQLRKGFEKK
jgi:hypothetical protein